VGFGISGPEQARALRGVADAVIVGAAFMRAVAEDPDPQRCVAAAGALADTLAHALRD